MPLLDQSDPASAWAQIRAELREALGESAYEIWIAPLELKALEQGLLLLQAPVATQGWIAERYGAILERCARAVLGQSVRVSIGGDRASPRPREAVGSETGEDPERVNLNPRYSFDQFVIGEGNRLAHAAALTVAELPGQAYNPLFLYAPPGLGKTHLLHAIGNYLTTFGGVRVRYSTAEAFTNHFIRALGSHSLAGFKRIYRDADVLLVDDVQFLASKARTEEEFFHTFDALYETGRQLVLTCDRLPSALKGVEERLRERFEAGLVADIRPPDLPTRMAILRKRALLDAIAVQDEAVLELIARRVTDNVRSLEGALIRIVAYHSLTDRPVDLELARTVLDGMYPHKSTGSGATVGVIQEVVASHFGLALAELTSSSRAAMVSWPRQLAIYLTRELTHASLQEIGDAFGGRNHATVVHACKRVNERVRADVQAAAELERLSAALGQTS